MSCNFDTNQTKKPEAFEKKTNCKRLHMRNFTEIVAKTPQSKGFHQYDRHLVLLQNWAVPTSKEVCAHFQLPKVQT